MMKTTDAMKCMEKAFALLSKISVKEEDVERMAVAKQELRAAYAELKAPGEREGANGQTD